MTAPRIVLYAIFAAAAATLATLFLQSAPYGRHHRKGWGFSLRARTAWIAMELPAMVVIAVMAAASRRFTPVTLLLLCAWEVHYLYRTLVYPALMRSSPRTFPLLLAVIAWVFNTANCYVNGWHLFYEGAAYPLEWLTDPRFIAGMALFAAGFATHTWADAVLRGLRKPGESGYSIPRGGLFELVSAPNYLGEIVQWLGWALATWSFAGLSFAVFTIANLLPRAVSHHRWYRATFPDYPVDRKAIIPLIL
jgi:3-oxo-5-alpha-steroid 4-dehydrogenase 1